MENMEYTAMYTMKEFKKCRNLSIAYGTFTTTLAGFSLYAFTDPKFKVFFAGAFLLITGVGTLESVYSQNQINKIRESKQYKYELELEEKNKIREKQIQEYRERINKKYFNK